MGCLGEDPPSCESTTYSLYDPLGFIAHYIMKAKLLLQTLNRKRLGLDDLIGETERSQ